MKKYIVELTDAEDKALSIVAVSQQEWIQNIVKERCRIAIEEIIAVEVQRMLEIGEPITGSKDDIVLAAVIETAEEREIRIQEEFRKLQVKDNK